MDELKPCPFCGCNEQEIWYAFNRVACKNPDCGAAVTGSCMMKAKEAWNRRTP